MQLNGAGNMRSTGLAYASEILGRFGAAFARAYSSYGGSGPDFSVLRRTPAESAWCRAAPS